MNGRLTQLAAATAANGTNRPKIGGIRRVIEFKNNAVAVADDVAMANEVANRLVEIGLSPDLDYIYRIKLVFLKQLV